MTEDTETDFARTDPEEPLQTLDHVTVENDDGPDECAIFPKDASERQLVTTWIAAYEDSFVDLETSR